MSSLNSSQRQLQSGWRGNSSRSSSNWGQNQKNNYPQQQHRTETRQFNQSYFSKEGSSNPPPPPNDGSSYKTSNSNNHRYNKGFQGFEGTRSRFQSRKDHDSNSTNPEPTNLPKYPKIWQQPSQAEWENAEEEDRTISTTKMDNRRSWTKGDRSEEDRASNSQLARTGYNRFSWSKPDRSEEDRVGNIQTVRTTYNRSSYSKEDRLEEVGDNQMAERRTSWSKQHWSDRGQAGDKQMAGTSYNRNPWTKLNRSEEDRADDPQMTETSYSRNSWPKEDRPEEDRIDDTQMAGTSYNRNSWSKQDRSDERGRSTSPVQSQDSERRRKHSRSPSCSREAPAEEDSGWNRRANAYPNRLWRGGDSFRGYQPNFRGGRGGLGRGRSFPRGGYQRGRGNFGRGQVASWPIPAATYIAPISTPVAPILPAPMRSTIPSQSPPPPPSIAVPLETAPRPAAADSTFSVGPESEPTSTPEPKKIIEQESVSTPQLRGRTDEEKVRSTNVTPIPSGSGKIEQFERLAQVGEGTYGKVYKAKSRSSGTIVAMKRIRLESEKDGFPITAMREIRLLKSLKHENIVDLQEVMYSKGNVFLIFEYMDHDLAGYLHCPKLKLQSQHIKCLMQQLLSGLGYLHTLGILHRDMKGSNLLINRRGELKLADFGLARIYPGPKRDLTNRVITLWYRSPELLLGSTEYDSAVDNWSAGCIFLEMFTKKAFFQGRDELTQLDEIYKVCGTPSVSDWPEVVFLPWYAMIRPRASRPSCLAQRLKELLTSEAAVDMAVSLLAMNPLKRMSAQEALEHDYFSKEKPGPCQPRELPSLAEDWHEFESKQRMKRRMA